MKNEMYSGPWKYYKLLDFEHRNMIVRVDPSGDSVLEQIFENGKWRSLQIMCNYYFDFADCYDLYEEITEKEADKIVGEAAIKDAIPMKDYEARKVDVLLHRD